MRIIEPRQLHTARYRGMHQRKRIKILPLLFILILLSGTVAATLRFRRPKDAPVVAVTQQRHSAKDPGFVWPQNEQAAVGAVGYGLLSSSDNQKVAPSASTAKIITALAVLQKKPLSKDQPGENIVVTEQDVAIYNKYVAIEGSVVPVQVGGSLTQYQALQALLLPSANNVAEMLANWAFGSEAAYVDFANSFVKQIGLTNTEVADASGFSANTRSTASDLVRLGIAAQENEVVSQIVAMPQATIPMAGVIRSTNMLLGENGIDGVKTGNTDEAGGCYIVSSTQRYEGGQTVKLVAAVMGAPKITDAMNIVKPLLIKARAGFSDVIVVSAGQQFGTVTSAWGTSSIFEAEKDLKIFGWYYGVPTFVTKINSSNFTKGTKAGVTTVQFGPIKSSVPLVQAEDLGQPDIWWRLGRIFSN